MRHFNYLTLLALALLSTGGPPLSNDNHGHGTATTGIIASNGASSNGSADFSGVAPEATIISIKGRLPGQRRKP